MYSYVQTYLNMGEAIAAPYIMKGNIEKTTADLQRYKYFSIQMLTMLLNFSLSAILFTHPLIQLCSRIILRQLKIPLNQKEKTSLERKYAINMPYGELFCVRCDFLKNARTITKLKSKNIIDFYSTSLLNGRERRVQI